MRRIINYMLLLTFLSGVKFQSALKLPIEDERFHNSEKNLRSRLITSMPMFLNEEKINNYDDENISKRTIRSSELPASPAVLLRPDKFQFYTFNQRGDVITKQMTEQQIQSLIAAGGGHLPMEIHEPQKAGDVPLGGLKVADVVRNVQNVLSSELNKPTPVITSMPTIPGHANSDWSSILPSILSGDMETISSGEQSMTIVTETPEIISINPIEPQSVQKNNGMSSSNDNKFEEKPMIQVPVITVDELPNRQSLSNISYQHEKEQSTNGPIFEKLNTISASQLKDQQKLNNTILTSMKNTSVQNQMTDASEIIDQSIKYISTNNATLENKNNTIIDALTDTNSMSIKVPVNEDEIKTQEILKPKPDIAKPVSIKNDNKIMPNETVKVNQTENIKLDTVKLSDNDKITSEIKKPIEVLNDIKNTSINTDILNDTFIKQTTEFNVEITTIVPVKNISEQTGEKIVTEVSTKATDTPNIPIVLLSIIQTSDKKNMTNETLKSSTTEKPEVEITTIYSTPITTTVKIDIPTTTLTSITTTPKVDVTTGTISVTEPVKLIQEDTKVEMTNPAVETKTKKPQILLTTKEAIIDFTTENPSTTEAIKTFTTVTQTEEASTTMSSEFISSTDATLINLVSLNSTKIPLNPLPIDLADSLSSMISQISKDVPVVVTSLDKNKTDIPMADLTNKFADIMQEKTTIKEEISTTEIPTTVKYSLNDNVKEILSIKNTTSSTIEETTTVQPTTLDAVITTTEKTSMKIKEQNLNDTTDFKIQSINIEKVSLINENNKNILKDIVTVKSVVDEESTETPIVRIDVMETKPDTIVKKNITESVGNLTESPLVRIQIKESISTIHQLLESSPIVTSTPAVEILTMPTNGAANNISSGLIAGYPSNETTLLNLKPSENVKLESKEDTDSYLDTATSTTANVYDKKNLSIFDLIEKYEATTEKIQIDPDTTEFTMQKIEFDQLPISKNKPSLSTTTTTTEKIEKEKNKIDNTTVEITTESFKNSTEISIIKNSTTAQLIENIKSTDENLSSSSFNLLPVTSTELPKIENIVLKNTTPVVESTTVMFLEILNSTMSNIKNDTKTVEVLPMTTIKPLNLNASVVRVDTTPEIQTIELLNSMKPTAPKKSDTNDTLISVNDESKIKVDQTTVKGNKLQTTQPSVSSTTSYVNDSYKKLGETHAVLNKSSSTTSSSLEKIPSSYSTDIPLKVKDQKKDSSMELLEIMLPNKISTNLKPSSSLADNISSQTIKPETTTKLAELIKINESAKIPLESEKWTLIPQKPLTGLIKNGNYGGKINNKKPIEAVIEKESKKPTSETEILQLSLDHATTAESLDTSVKNLDNDVLYFTNLCNDLAFTFWTATNQGLSNARSLALSPFGMTSMLAMVFLGARGPTSDKMNDILKLDDVASFNPHLVFQNVTDSLSIARKQGIANAAFVRELFADRLKVRKLMPFYKEQAQQFYDGSVAEVNFATISDLARRRTNLMIRQQTGGRIKNFVSDNIVSLKAPLAALSANVFQSDCNDVDASSEGRDGELYFAVSPAIRQRKLIPVPSVVWRKGVYAGYEPGLDATAVSLGGPEKLISTIFVIPGQQGFTASGDNLELLEERLIREATHDGAWNKILKVIIPRPGIELQLPKFSHKSIINATSALKRMGLEELFDKHANLKGINGVGADLHLSDVLQMNLFSTCGDENIMNSKNHVEVYPGTPQRNIRFLKSEKEDEFDYNENSEEEKDDVLLSRPVRQTDESEKPRIKLDRPFLYFVRHNPTGLILHMGRFNPRLLP
ncbi:mucin-17 isoform X3 [Aphidius gifuensis]|uniref:mucin-17 isoform X3 n=1 Tax=Aphidius gifuensis TaxID=684658 RepID=UPI001CDB5C32|nr:mucin-17 isoform X3 [Aphidius gifuensis]